MLRIRFSKGGGKAGKGHNKTASVQVIQEFPGGYLIKKIFRYTVASNKSKSKAIEKAQSFIKETTN